MLRIESNMTWYLESAKCRNHVERKKNRIDAFCVQKRGKKRLIYIGGLQHLLVFAEDETEPTEFSTPQLFFLGGTFPAHNIKLPAAPKTQETANFDLRDDRDSSSRLQSTP